MSISARAHAGNLRPQPLLPPPLREVWQVGIHPG
jgi:hypothetical protein